MMVWCNITSVILFDTRSFLMRISTHVWKGKAKNRHCTCYPCHKVQVCLAFSLSCFTWLALNTHTHTHTHTYITQPLSLSLSLSLFKSLCISVFFSQTQRHRYIHIHILGLWDPNGSPNPNGQNKLLTCGFGRSNGSERKYRKTKTEINTWVCKWVPKTNHYPFLVSRLKLEKGSDSFSAWSI